MCIDQLTDTIISPRRRENINAPMYSLTRLEAEETKERSGMIDLNEEKLAVLSDILLLANRDVSSLRDFARLRDKGACDPKDITNLASFTNSSLRVKISLINKLVYADDESKDEREEQILSQEDVDTLGKLLG